MNQDTKLTSNPDALGHEPVAQPSEALEGSLTGEEELQLLQLLQKRYWRQRRAPRTEDKFRLSPSETKANTTLLPDQWATTLDLTLHNWQRKAVTAWFENGMRGIMKVVTGAGKTVLALAIIEALQRTTNPGLRVAIVVPTIVLMDQWADEFAQHSNLPNGSIGFVGAGHSDNFGDSTRVLICVLNSAAKRLAMLAENAGVGKDLLLIVDECHRAGAPEMKKLFRTRRSYALGLSATPERDDQDRVEDPELDPTFRQDDVMKLGSDTSILQEHLGEIIVEMNYDDAIKLGVLPPFRIVHYGLRLSALERQRYERLSREISDLREALETGKRRGLALIRWCRSKAAAREPRAARFLALTSERKRLLYRMGERSAAVVSILREARSANPECKAILFHESIDEVMRIFEALRKVGFAVVAEHSEFPDQMRSDSLRLFRSGMARVIVSARSLIEGFNVPSADIGIVVAASSSVRQRVQTLGRLLRKSKRSDGSEKVATLYALYASDTVDELIYEKFDWGSFTGASRNEFFQWAGVEDSKPVPCNSAPRVARGRDVSIDASLLRPGQPYPGDPNEGSIYSLDLQKTISTEEGDPIEPHPELAGILSDSRMMRRGGRFRVTPVKKFVIKLERTADGWQSIYLGQLSSPLRVAKETIEQQKAGYSPGDPYPLSKAKGASFYVLPRDKRLIAEKTKRGTRFVKPSEAVENPQKRNALCRIQEEVALLLSRGRRISKITVTPQGHVVYVFENHAYFIGNAPEGTSGFDFED
ncbi:MAG: DEAD/DEAH box helicase [Acidobacteria bacterium]|nr:DEAD/DEAH box helicase [Acidobacteriota bacterium]